MSIYSIDVVHCAFYDPADVVAHLDVDAGSIEEALEQAYKATQNVESSWVESKGQFGIAVKPVGRATRFWLRCCS